MNDFIMPNEDWNLEKLHHYLPEDICSEILKAKMCESENATDSIVWNHPKEIDFTVKSAYRILSKEEQLCVG